ncbi:hypothetical protein BH11BAC5_BH11BAC5_46080 [soil metagenome]
MKYCYCFSSPITADALYPDDLYLSKKINENFLFLLPDVIISLTVSAQYSNDIRLEKLLKTDTTETGQHIQYPGISNEEVTI